MSTNVLVVGGGLSGLAATWQLHRHGIDVLLVEGRERFGGRVLTVPHGDGFFDMGPSWIWHGQPYVTGLLDHFGISTYEQFCDGDLLHQQANGAIHRDSMLKPMQHSLRIIGGIGALTAAIADDIPSERVRLETVVTGLAVCDDKVTLTARGPGGETSFSAKHVALALPPRLAASIVFQPPLDDSSLRLLQATPTWMAGHAKFFAIYDSPFWREKGLSGDALSRRGPLAEIHDASPSSGGPYAVFGFVGVDGPARAAMTRTKLIQASKAQLVEFFGQEADETQQVHLMDWSNEPLTAAPTDQRAPDHHPQYGIHVELDDAWRNVLHFIGSETDFEHGGLVEGALRQGLAYAAKVARSQRVSIQSPGAADIGESHNASMNWDWFGPS